MWKTIHCVCKYTKERKLINMYIKVENITKIIKSSTVLKDINLEFHSGKIYGIVGKNGSGKTMLLRVIAGLIKPTKGTVFIDGKMLHKDISFPPEMGIIIEKPELLEQLSGLENLKILAEIKNIISEEQIIEFMKMFSLDPHSKKPLRKYSLGMKQKIGIIQAIMENQKLLILDEPFNALDESTVTMLRDLFRKYRDNDKLLIITSHHADDISFLCDEIISLQEGVVR